MNGHAEKIDGFAGEKINGYDKSDNVKKLNGHNNSNGRGPKPSIAVNNVDNHDAEMEKYKSHRIDLVSPKNQKVAVKT